MTSREGEGDMNLAVRHVVIACTALFVARLTMLDHGLAAVWGVDRGEDALGTIEWATVAGDIVAVVTCSCSPAWAIISAPPPSWPPAW